MSKWLILHDFIMYFSIKVGYYLDESRNWALDVQELERSIKEAKTRQEDSEIFFNHLLTFVFIFRCKVRAIVIINPGNPTGQVSLAQLQLKIILFSERFSRERILKQWSDLRKRRSSSYLLMRWKFV